MWKLLKERVGSKLLAQSGQGTVWEVIIIEAGVSLNGVLYSAELLRAAAPMFDGVPANVFTFGDTNGHLPSGVPPVFLANQVGFFNNSRFDEERQAVVARLNIFETEENLRGKLVEAFESGFDQLLGLSIDARATGEDGVIGGNRVFIVEEFQAIVSVDLVSHPAAGGKLLRLVASVQTAKGNNMHFLRLLEARRGWNGLVKRAENEDDNSLGLKVLKAAYHAAAAAFDGQTGAALEGLANGRKVIKEAIDLCEAGKSDQVPELLNPWFAKHPESGFSYPVAAAPAPITVTESRSSQLPVPVAQPVAQPVTPITPVAAAPVQPQAPVLPPGYDALTQTVGNMARIMEQNQAQLHFQTNIKPIIEQSGLPEASRNRLLRLVESKSFTVDETKVLVQEEKDYIKTLVPQGPTSLNNAFGNPGEHQQRVQESSDQVDRYTLAWDGFFQNRNQTDANGQVVPRFRSLRHAFNTIGGRKSYGPVEEMARGVLEAVGRSFPYKFGDCTGESHDAFQAHQGRLTENWNNVASRSLRESVDSSDFSVSFGTSFYNTMQREYEEDPRSNWRKLVSSFENLTDITNDFSIVRIGMVPEMPIVPEKGAYADLVPTQTENAEVISPEKHGGLYQLTLESALADKVAFIRSIPFMLARSSNMTISRNVTNHLEANALMADGFALFDNANHANDLAGTPALSQAGIVTGDIAMRAQTGQDTTDKLGLRPKLLIVSDFNWNVAWELTMSDRKANATEDSTIPGFVKASGIEPVALVDIGLTAALQEFWYLMADPRRNETIVAAFLNGKDTPDLFVQGAETPTQGDFFSSDVITFKARIVVGSKVADHRTILRSAHV